MKFFGKPTRIIADGMGEGLAVSINPPTEWSAPLLNELSTLLSAFASAERAAVIVVTFRGNPQSTRAAEEQALSVATRNANFNAILAAQAAPGGRTREGKLVHSLNSPSRVGEVVGFSPID